MNGQPTYESMVDQCVNVAMMSCRNMTSDQLSDILFNDTKIDSIIDNLPQIRSMPTEREACVAQNRSLAEWNLQQEPRLNQLKTNVKSLYENALALKSNTEELKKKLDTISANRSLDTTSNLLQVAAQEADDEAEAFAREFEQGSVGSDRFMREFLEKKTLAHIRKIKSERLLALLREQQYAPAASYPAAMGMPQPGYPPVPQPRNKHNFF